MIPTAAANCDQAGLHGQIRAWLADNGYASAANFAALEHLMLLVAVHGEATQTGRGTGGRACRRVGEDGRPAGHPGRQEPVQAARHPRRARLRPAVRPVGRYVSYHGRNASSTPRSSSWAPCTTSPSSWISGAGPSVATA